VFLQANTGLVHCRGHWIALQVPIIATVKKNVNTESTENLLYFLSNILQKKTGDAYGSGRYTVRDCLMYCNPLNRHYYTSSYYNYNEYTEN
jgi:hypothetical protein